jgi:hypothetical protein
VCPVVPGVLFYSVGHGNPKQSQLAANRKIYDSDHKLNRTYRQYVTSKDFDRYRWHLEKESWIAYGENLAEPRFYFPFDLTPKIIVKKSKGGISAHLDDFGYVTPANIYNLMVRKKVMKYHYLLGIINSTLLRWWYKYKYIIHNPRDEAQIVLLLLKKLPLVVPSGDDRRITDRIASCAAKLLQYHKEQAAMEQNELWQQLKNEIIQTDLEIDRLVYTLYGLSEEEIAIVETKTENPATIRLL